MKTIIAFFCLIYFSNPSFSQTFVHKDHENIDPSKIEKWYLEEKSGYQGVYYFGFSEGESDLILIVTGDSCYAQLKRGKFIDNGRDFIWDYLPLKNVRIEGNKFYSDLSNGEFALYNGKTQGLIINHSWTWNDKVSEFGSKIKGQSLEKYIPGKFPQASYRYLTNAELKKMKYSDLKIMRNEIFARYGYIFDQNGEMDEYFRTQKWYQAKNKSTDKFLTSLEKQNILLIQTVEKNYGL